MVRRALFLLPPALMACEGGADKGLAVGPGPHGPKVIFEPLLQPTPDVPFPNDLLLRADETSPSGFVWNVSTEEPTHHQQRIRAGLNRLDGFGPFAPAFLSFDAPLDLATVTEETVAIVNIEPGHPREGERAPLDLGKGHFPDEFTRAGAYFGQDPNAELPGMLYGADNVFDMDGDGTPEPVVHFDYSSNTLVLRPVVPLAQGARHAVLITRAVKGTDGKPVRSAFDTKAHAAQAEEIERALELANVDASDLAFAWTYTTGDLTTPLLNARDGLYGTGPLAHLAESAPPRILEVRANNIPQDNADEMDPRDHGYILQAPFMSKILNLIADVQGDDNYKLTFNHVDHIVFGSMAPPDLRTGELRTFGVDLTTGEGEVAEGNVPFMVCVPKETKQHKQPFDVIFYFHGTGTSRMEAIALCDTAARQGLAMMSFDQVGHGPLFDLQTVLDQNPDQRALIETAPLIVVRILAPDRLQEFANYDFDTALEKLYEIGLFAELAQIGRNEGDVNGNGVLEIGRASCRERV